MCVCVCVRTCMHTWVSFTSSKVLVSVWPRSFLPRLKEEERKRISGGRNYFGDRKSGNLNNSLYQVCKQITLGCYITVCFSNLRWSISLLCMALQGGFFCTTVSITISNIIKNNNLYNYLKMMIFLSHLRDLDFLDLVAWFMLICKLSSYHFTCPEHRDKVLQIISNNFYSTHCLKISTCIEWGVMHWPKTSILIVVFIYLLYSFHFWQGLFFVCVFRFVCQLKYQIICETR